MRYLAKVFIKSNPEMMFVYYGPHLGLVRGSELRGWVRVRELLRVLVKARVSALPLRTLQADACRIHVQSMRPRESGVTKSGESGGNA